jgi:hypothetical protein
MLSFLNCASKAQAEGIQLGIFTVSNESLVPRARNYIISSSLQSEVPWDKFLFIDADIQFSWEDVKRLLSSGEQIVGGAYPVKALPIHLNYNPKFGDGLKYFPDGRRSVAQHEAFAAEEATSDGEAEVRHLATGFLLIDRSVFEVLRPKVPSYVNQDIVTKQEVTNWDFFPAGVSENHYMSEDWGFCNLARAHGFHIYLNTKVIVGHVGSHTYRPEPK